MSAPPAQESAEGAEAASGGRTLDRIVELLVALAEADEPLPVGVLAERVQLPLSSTYRLVGGLEHHGLVDRPARGGITLGLRVLELASGVEARLETALVRPARPVMERLAGRTGETVLLTAAVGASAIGLHSVAGRRSIALTFALGRLSPLHRGASSRVLLAFLAEDARARALAELAAAEPGLDLEALRDELATIRAAGHVITHADLDAGASAVAAPIRDGRGRLLAGLAVAGPTARVVPALDALVSCVRDDAAEIAAAVQAAGRPEAVPVGSAA